MSGRPKLCVIDGAGYYYRAFFGIRSALSNSKGLPTNAVYGFATMLRRILKEERPDHIVVALDSKEKTFRHDIYDQYKANRPEMPKELSIQLPYIDSLIDALNIKTLKVPGFEADDIIGAVAVKGAEDGFDVVIATSDKDMAQLVRPGITLFDSMKDKHLDEAGVQEKFGVPPSRIIDLLGLMGDTSDNIPGVPGVGGKTALALVKEFGALEAVLESAESVSRKKVRENLIEYKEQALLSKRLATISLDAPVGFDPDGWKVVEPDLPKLKALYSELEFISLLKDIEGERAPQPVEYTLVSDEDSLADTLDTLSAMDVISITTYPDSLDSTEAKLAGLAIGGDRAGNWYIPVVDNLDSLKKLFENDQIKKIGPDLKKTANLLATSGIRFAGGDFDTGVAGYLLDPSGACDLTALAISRLGETMITESAILGSGVKRTTINNAPLDSSAPFATSQAAMAFRLAALLQEELKQKSLLQLFEEIEIPLIATLARIEQNGVLIDEKRLADLSNRMGERVSVLEEKIEESAGEKFNVNSPKQLGEILFDKLLLPGGKKKKTGYSTSQDTLERLKDLHELPSLALEYRKLTKLKNTYIDALPKMINRRTGRIHTSYNQTVTATGRLSSSDPNLQNIPIRTEAGREIRRSFIPAEGYKLVSADYSQIELRLLAHFSGEPALVEAFSNNEDVHSSTASRIFGVDPAFVTSDMRAVAKTVNFGVIYGQTAFGLSQELNIPRGSAQRYIDGYFARHPGISAYINRTVAEAKRLGYVTTIMGRKRYLPDLLASNKMTRQFAERNAVNTPMQGSAADLIKKAMIDIDRLLAREGHTSMMILQVHDELVFEIPEGDVERLIPLIRSGMEEVFELKVPLVVDIGIGDDWEAAH